MHPRHWEQRRNERTGWLRAAVLGANDGIVSTASLVLGVAAAQVTHSNVLVAGEYVSVHSQADTEQADIERERKEINRNYPGESQELAAIYVGRGLDPPPASLWAQPCLSLSRHWFQRRD